ncbi:hypothetical protein GS399_17735 [Pedobacter sp. HMF7647]|uniref:Glucose-methanol-choline oxidoreductase C-terminal domain-containing protein n=1 Tax=Hufsiella arboris TaxID=2695275 RepID=A0A7K1YDY9_9SPHI|nr:GMC family oxidoreductase [Hufsiella arboris]MXV52817.1 hypothetical protein [Hufsiella arboris]
MPFHRFEDSLTLNIPENFDYTIVGAGAAGIFLAVNLSNSGYKVLLIESGLFDLEERYQALNDVISTGLPMGGISWGRKRAVGGTTLAWGGQSLPFSAIDFSHPSREDVDSWPIELADLEPHYKAANAFMGIHDNDYYGPEILSRIKLRDPGFNDTLISYHVSKWAKEPNFKKLYQKHLEKHVFVLYNATVSNLCHSGESVQKIELINFDGFRKTLDVKNLILAGGAVECNRLLLNHSNLFAKHNNFQLLGKGFMDHPCITVGYVETEKQFKLQRYFNTHHINHQKISLRLSLAEKTRLKSSLLNCSVSILFSPPSDFDLYEKVKALLKKFDLKKALSLVPFLPKFALSAYAYSLQSFFYKIKTTPEISLMVEQNAIDTSYLRLSDISDEMGLPKLEVHWDISRPTWNTVLAATSIVKEELERLGFGKVIIRPEIDPDNSGWKLLLSDVNHHMGGCKMSKKAENGIVDQNLKVWDTQNLFVASTAVFPTGSHSNPTLTLLALCNRLADHLKQNN